MKYGFLLLLILFSYESSCGPEFYRSAQSKKNDSTGIRIRKYDRKIIRAIRRNSNLEKKTQAAELQAAVRKLPCVTDVLYDDCYEKLMIYPGYIYLTVKMDVKGKQVERQYYMRTAKLRFIGIRFKKRYGLGRYVELNKHRLDYRSCAYSPGFIDAARKHCLKKEH